MGSSTIAILHSISLQSLPDELLINIASFILGDTAPRFEGVVQCITPEDAEDEIDHELEQVRREARSILSDLRSLALASRRLRPIAQEILFRAPILYDQKREYKKSPIVSLARTLLERPDLALFVRILRVNVPSDYATAEVVSPPPGSFVFRKSIALVDRLNIDVSMKKHWKKELVNFYPRAFCGIILSLATKLEQLHLAPSIKHDSGRELLPLLFGDEGSVSATDLTQISGLRNLSSLKIVVEAPFDLPGLQLLSRLSTLDMCIEPFYNYYEHFLTHPPASYLDSVRHLRLDCRIRKIGLAGKFLDDLRMVTHMFRNLESLHLYGESPWYDHREDSYNGDWLHWYENQLRDKSYSALLATLGFLAPTLRTLEIPRGFWTLPNKIHSSGVNDMDTGEVTNFQAFGTLKHLLIPTTAIVRKYLEKTTRADPVDTLPLSLERIIVFGTDEELWPWIEDVLDNRCSHFTSLTEMEVVQEGSLYPRPSLEKLDELKVDHERFWNKLMTSGIKFTFSC